MGQIAFVIVAVSLDTVLLWMKSIDILHKVRRALSLDDSISSIICKCLLSTLNQNVDIQDANIAGKTEGNLASTVTSEIQLPRNSSSRTYALEDKLSFTRNWMLILQEAKKLFIAEGVVEHYVTNCVKFERFDEFMLETELFRGAILDVRINREKKLYALMIRNSGKKSYPGSDGDLIHCGYEVDHFVPEDRPLMARLNSDLAKLYATFGGKTDFEL